MNKPSNECFKCKSRFCSSGIISVSDKGEKFNEIACTKHIDDLEEKADEVLGHDNGVMRLSVSTTGGLSRRILKERYLARLEAEVEE
jgi:flagellar basal body rod protein FlgF